MRWLTSLLVFVCNIALASDRPNVLFIVADDLNCDLGCYGNKTVHSPNIDEIAKTGVKFQKAYVQYSVCNPSRTSFLTSIRPETSKVVSNGEFFRKKLPDVVTLPQLFKQNGYSSVGLGKIFHRVVNPENPKAESDDAKSWDRTFYGQTTKKGNEGEGRNLTKDNVKWCRWLAAEGDDSDQPDGQIAAEAVNILGQKHEKPFFLAVGFSRPHDPFQSPKKYFEHYPLDDLKSPSTPEGYSVPNKYSLPQNSWVKHFHAFTEKDKKEFLRAYYAGVTFVDAQVGKLLDALDKHDLTKNTIVVFLGDHGYELGQRDWWNKDTLFERSTRAPLIVRDPRAKGNGDLHKGLVEFVDLYPTLVDRCDLKDAPSKQIEGKSFSSKLDDPTLPGKSHATTIVMRGPVTGRTVRTEQFRYTNWDGQHPELYETAKDPDEWKNLASDPKYAEVITEMKKKLPK